MSNFGMQMPGGSRSRGPSPDVYTALMCVGTVCMLAAVVMLYIAGTKVAPDGQPWNIQEKGENQIRLPR
ncbi:MAG: hypothetical protein LAT64_02450 [Phycisphaerales bacterium]|nr:hypothetical protein [Planctomycetota bacterium]MCH8507619.1 hypothetical protein [Phycisphaerales bacterium]